MRINMAFRWGHRALTVILLIIVIVGGVLWYSGTVRGNDKLISQKQLSENVWLYVTQYQDAGATNSDVFRYYLNKQLSDPMPTITKSAPVLQADTGSAVVTSIGDHVMIRLTGKIYSFSNSSFFYDGETAVMPRIDLNSTAPPPWE